MDTQNDWQLMGILVVLLISGLFQVSALSAQSVTPSQITPLHEVKQDANGDGVSDLDGDTVTVTGIANISTGQLHEIYLQVFLQNDSTGFSIFSESFDTPINRGDSVVATGVVQEYFGLTEIQVFEYSVFPRSGPMPDPIPLSRAVLNPWQYEGMLVEGDGRVVGKGNRFNGKFLNIVPSDTSTRSIMVYVSNFHSQYAAFDFASLSAGDEVQVRGVMSQYDTGDPGARVFKITLRTPDDLEVLGIARSTLIWLGAVGILIILVVIGWIISLRSRVKSKTRQIRKSLEEKDLLLKEIHHRVKNNLAIISGLIELQLESSADKETQKVLRDSQTRIQSMALVHDKLYRTNTVTDIGMRTYIEDLVEALRSTFTGPDEEIELQFDVDELNLDIDRAIPCGLLINELVVNAFKHAFGNGENGTLEVKLKKDYSGAESGPEIKLSVADNGKGLPENFEDKLDSSLGMMLIKTFTSQLDATMEVENEDGAHFIFRFPAETGESRQ